MKSLLHSRHQRKYTFLFLLCLWFSFEAYTQVLGNIYINSVLSTVNRKTSEEKIESYYAINKYINKQPSEEKRPLFKYALSKDSTDLSKMILYTRYGENFHNRGLTDEALKIKLAGLELAERINNERFIIEYNVSVRNAYLYQNLPDKALFYFNTAQSLSENGGNDDFLWNIYYHKGLLQNVLGDIDGQTIYYLKNVERSKKLQKHPKKEVCPLHFNRFLCTIRQTPRTS